MTPTPWGNACLYVCCIEPQYRVPLGRRWISALEHAFLFLFKPRHLRREASLLPIAYVETMRIPTPLGH